MHVSPNNGLIRAKWGHLTLITHTKKEESDKASPTGNRANIFYAAAGDKNNDQVTLCRVCASNGWPHEPIDFEKVYGRLCNDGTYEAARWKLRDYFTGRPHQHKLQRGPNKSI